MPACACSHVRVFEDCDPLRLQVRHCCRLYSIFLPIEAGLFTPEEAVQALHFTEWGLERNAISCDLGGSKCGEVCWTSNWVPSMWSVRQLWSGDNSGLALAYFLSGLPDDGWTVLQGTLHRDMLQSAVPGMSGGTNGTVSPLRHDVICPFGMMCSTGGTDFNDCVHPLSRALIEGLFGYRPDYITGVVTIAPQFPSSWANGSLSSADVVLQFSTSATLSTLCVTLTLPTPRLEVHIPIRAQSVVDVQVSGLASGASFNYTMELGFGQTVLVITVVAGSAPISTATVVVSVADALPYRASVAASGVTGRTVSLSAPSGRVFTSFADPQGVFNGTGTLSESVLTGVVAASAQGHHLIIAYARTRSPSIP